MGENSVSRVEKSCSAATRREKPTVLRFPLQFSGIWAGRHFYGRFFCGAAFQKKPFDIQHTEAPIESLHVYKSEVHIQV